MTKQQQDWIDNLPGEKEGVFFVTEFPHFEEWTIKGEQTMENHAGWARFRLRGKEMMRPFREYKAIKRGRNKGCFHIYFQTKKMIVSKMDITRFPV